MSHMMLRVQTVHPGPLRHGPRRKIKDVQRGIKLTMIQEIMLIREFDETSP
jgi:hypothetical protein